MLTKTQYSVDLSSIQQSLSLMPSTDNRITINQPTGNFFYDPWIIKPEFVGTVWEKLYDSLLVQNKGEARIMSLQGGTTYSSHADVDNRYHINLSGIKCYMIDLDNSDLIPIIADGYWYNMDAGRHHVAMNLGNRVRHQLVIRHLLNWATLKDSVRIVMKVKQGIDPDDARFTLDDISSPWINRANINGIINDFDYKNYTVTFNLDSRYLEEFKNYIAPEWYLE